MIRLAQLQNRFPGFSLGPIDLHIAAGEFFILIGPTGSGKTVILESIVGLKRPDSGKIILDGRDVTRIPPEKRQVGIVFQDQALFPHLSVYENIVFGLRYQRQRPKPTRNVLEKIIETLALGSHLNKSVRDLSGGERQRAALARALAIAPRVLLLDEPLSALDPSFRGEIQQLLKQLHTSMDTTFLMVTHDFNEAFYLADRVGVLTKGTLEQTGSVAEVFQRPKNTRVGAFVGMKNMIQVRSNGKALTLAGIPVDGRDVYAGCRIGLRPEDIIVQPADGFPPGYRVGKGTLVSLTPQGFGCEMSVESCGETLLVHGAKGILRGNGLAVGHEVFMGFHPDALHIFPVKGGAG